MARVTQGRRFGAGDGAGNGGHPPSSLREGELPLRERRGAPHRGALELLARQQSEVGDPPRRADRGGASGNGALPGGSLDARSGGQCGPRGAGVELEAPKLSGAFSSSAALFGGIVTFLGSDGAAGLTHEELESRLGIDGRELTRQLLQEHVDLRAVREQRAETVVDEAGVAHNAVEAGHHRLLESVFGEVTVTRLAYRVKGGRNLHLQDAALNLPAERHSHGLRELCAIEATRGSYEEARSAIERATGSSLGKRQVEELACRGASDVDAFYDNTTREPVAAAHALVLSVDGKGIVMRADALRPATRKAAAASKHKLKTRLSRGEKKDRKRMAELAVVYDCAPVPRTPADILAHAEGEPRAPAPVAEHKWCTASVVEDTRVVIAAAFDEAERRDPGHDRQWVALVDGAKHQIDVIRAEARRRGIEIHITCDLIHVLEYLWGAARCFYAETDPAGETFVADKGLAILEGKAGIVAGSIRRKATMLGLDSQARKKVDDCATYLKNKAPYLDYPTALAKGWPIATGVIEGACAHLVRDRFDITGARWSLQGAEAMLKLRAVRTNGDWVEYWRHHLAQERKRVHASRYLDGNIPKAA